MFYKIIIILLIQVLFFNNLYALGLKSGFKKDTYKTIIKKYQDNKILDYFNIAGRKNYDAAIKDLNKLLSNSKKEEFDHYFAYSYLKRLYSVGARQYFQKEDYKKALSYLKELLNIVQKFGNTIEIDAVNGFKDFIEELIVKEKPVKDIIASAETMKMKKHETQIIIADGKIEKVVKKMKYRKKRRQKKGAKYKSKYTVQQYKKEIAEIDGQREEKYLNLLLRLKAEQQLSNSERDKIQLDIYLKLINIYYQDKNYKKIIKAYEIISNKHDLKLDILKKIAADAYYQDKQWERALELYNALIKLDMNNKGAYYKRMEICKIIAEEKTDNNSKIKFYERAFADCEKVKNDNSDLCCEIKENLYNLYCLSNQYEKAISLDQTSPEAYAEFGHKLYKQEGENSAGYKTAFFYYKNAVEKGTEDKNVYYNLVDIYNLTNTIKSNKQVLNVLDKYLNLCENNEGMLTIYIKKANIYKNMMDIYCEQAKNEESKQNLYKRVLDVFGNAENIFKKITFSAQDQKDSEVRDFNLIKKQMQKIVKKCKDTVKKVDSSQEVQSKIIGAKSCIEKNIKENKQDNINKGAETFKQGNSYYNEYESKHKKPEYDSYYRYRETIRLYNLAEKHGYKEGGLYFYRAVVFTCWGDKLKKSDYQKRLEKYKLAKDDIVKARLKLKFKKINEYETKIKTSINNMEQFLKKKKRKYKRSKIQKKQYDRSIFAKLKQRIMSIDTSTEAASVMCTNSYHKLCTVVDLAKYNAEQFCEDGEKYEVQGLLSKAFECYYKAAIIANNFYKDEIKEFDKIIRKLICVVEDSLLRIKSIQTEINSIDSSRNKVEKNIKNGAKSDWKLIDLYYKKNDKNNVQLKYYRLLKNDMKIKKQYENLIENMKNILYICNKYTGLNNSHGEYKKFLEIKKQTGGLFKQYSYEYEEIRREA